MNDLATERTAFLERKRATEMFAAERASSLLVGGVDLDQVLALPPPARQAYCRKIKRLLERERLKGVRGHWGYDLNRHIALKRVHDRLAASIDAAR